MSKRGENIFKRKDGRWEGRYEKGRRPNGSIIYGFCYGKTYREVRDKVRDCKTAVSLGKKTSKDQSHLLFAQFCDDWLADKKQQVKYSSYGKYRIIIETYIKPVIGNYRISSVDSEACNRVNQRMTSMDYSTKTIRDTISILRSVLNYTAKRIHGFDSKIELSVPKYEQKEMHVLSESEEKAFVQFLLTDIDECKFGILLAIMTGLRIGELCALKWADISVSDETISVGATMQRVQTFPETDAPRTAIIVGSPKSRKSIRTIPMSADCRELIGYMKQYDRNAYILTGTSEYMEPRTLQYRIKKYTQICGLSDVHFHTFRHTFATRAVEAGFEIKSLSEVLGHANTTITLNRYVHSSMQLKRTNMGKLPSILT